MEARQRELVSLKAQLEENRRILRGRLGRIVSGLRRDHPGEAMEYEEEAQKAENDEVLEQLDEQGRIELEQVEFALQRIGAGTYGKCVSCGDEIAVERLRALPWATHCFDCASERG